MFEYITYVWYQIYSMNKYPRIIWYIGGSYFLSQMEKLISNPVF